jgi:hypothetical protein
MTIVEEKDKIKAAIGHSPDFADSLLGGAGRTGRSLCSASALPDAPAALVAAIRTLRRNGYSF